MSSPERKTEINSRQASQEQRGRKSSVATNSNSRGGSNSNRRHTTKIKVENTKKDYEEDDVGPESPTKANKLTK